MTDGVADLLVRDTLIVPGGGASPRTGWLAIAGTTILATGTDAPEPEARAVIDGRRHAVIPGLVNAHAHSHSSLTRGSAEGRTLDPWIAAIEREQAILTEDDARVGAFATYAEALLSGTTAILDMTLAPEVAAEAARAIGIRAVIAPYAADTKPFAPSLARTAALLESRDDSAGRVTVWVGLHDLESCTDAQIAEGVALAAAHGTGLHLHCSETAASVERTRARTGRTPVAHLAALGALGPKTALAHGVHVDAADRALLAETGSGIVHCPHANMKLGSGIAPVAAMLDDGVQVALGTDGAKANNRLDPFDVMKFASLGAKGVARDASLLPPASVLDMAGPAGARMLGLGTERLEPGAPADLVMVRVDRLHMQPAEPATIEANLVHAARGGDVDTVIVDGRVVVREGRLATLDEAAVLADLSRVGRALLARVDSAGAAA
ncbi:MAG: amidohydrolase [Azospirillaceae bacterium]